MASLVAFFLSDLDGEFERTRRMLERVPAAHLDFKPHEKSWPLKGMARHMATLPSLGILTLRTDTVAPDGPSADAR
jgi:hypothetical protein